MAISTIRLTIEVPLNRNLLFLARDLEACPEYPERTPSVAEEEGEGVSKGSGCLVRGNLKTAYCLLLTVFLVAPTIYYLLLTN